MYPGEVNEAPVIVALARAFRWQKYIDEGKFSNIRKLAKAVGLDESVVGATLRLRWLAPGLVHDILSGGCKDVSLKQLRHGVPELWREQVPGMGNSETEKRQSTYERLITGSFSGETRHGYTVNHSFR